MADAGFIDAGGGRPATAGAARRRAARARSRGAVLRRLRRRSTLGEDYPGLTTTTDEAVDVYTTLDLHLQRLAQDAVRDGLAQRRRAAVAPQAQGPRRGGAASPSIRAPARSSRWSAAASYNQSQYNRAVTVAAAARARSSSRSSTSRRSSRPPPTRRDRRDAGHARRRHARRRGIRTAEGLDAGQLRAGVRRPHHAAARARACRATSRRSRSPSRPATTRSPALWTQARRRRHAAAAVPVDRARRVRSDAARDRRRPTRSSPTWALVRPLQSHRCASSAMAGTLPIDAGGARRRSRGPTRPTSSPT